MVASSSMVRWVTLLCTMLVYTGKDMLSCALLRGGMLWYGMTHNMVLQGKYGCILYAMAWYTHTEGIVWFCSARKWFIVRDGDNWGLS